MDSRRNVRAALCKRVSLQGTDRWGKPFQIEGDSVDFSRRGIGLILDRDVIAPGSIISVKIPKRFNSSAVVQWSRADSNGRVRLGLKLLKFNASLGLRFAASILLCLALIGQLGFSRSRATPRGQHAASSCTVSLERMKSMLESALSGFAVVTGSDKAFLHIQHERLGCEEYTRVYEKSDFYSNEKTRAALANWHWTVYHGKDEKARAAAIHQIEATLQPVH